MIRTRRLVAILACCWCAAAGAAEDPLTAVTVIRDGLLERYRARVEADLAEGPARELRLRFDDGIGKGAMLVVLHHQGGRFARAEARGIRREIPDAEIDYSGLAFAGGKLVGELVFTWRAEVDGEAVARSQTYVLEGAAEQREERLFLTLHRFVGRDDWTLVYAPEGDGWRHVEDATTPKVFATWGPFEREDPGLTPDGDGRIAVIAKLTKVREAGGDEDEDRLFDAYQERGHPEIAIDFHLASGRAAGTWRRAAAGGKHLFGSGTDMVSGVVRDTVIAARYLAEGHLGRWAGTAEGPALPAPTATDAATAEAPEGTGAVARLAHRYHQVCALDLALRRYPLPVQAAFDRTAVPPPTFDGGDGAAVWTAGILAAARSIADGAAAAHRGRPITADPDFGPFYGHRDLVVGEALPAGDGPQEWVAPTGWEACGPFPVFDQRTAVIRPEIVPAPGAAYARRRPYVPEDGVIAFRDEPANWLPAHQDRALVALPHAQECSAGAMRAFCWYATTTIESASAREAWMALEVQGRARLWVNGAPVYDSGPDFLADEPAIFRVPLREGKNRLLLRCGSSPRSNDHYGTMHYFDGYGARPMGRAPFVTFAMHLATAGEPGADAAPTQAVAASFRGYRGDGTGRFPDADPPLAWDLEEGRNVAWKLELPTGSADPVVHGGAVFVTAEPHVLVCIDLASGEERWRTSTDIFATVDGVTRDDDPLVAYVAGRARIAALRHEAREAGDRDANDAAIAEIEAEWEEIEDFLKARGIRYRDGWANATPVVTDDAVYVHFGTGVVARYDHAGERIWMRATGAPWSDAGMGSPVLVDGKLVVQAHLDGDDGRYGLIAFDAASGERLWETRAGPKRVVVQYDRATGLGNGIVATTLTRGEHVRPLIVTGDGVVVDAGDGRILHRDVCDPEAVRAGPYVIGTDVYFVSTVGESRVRLWLNGEGRVGAKNRWYHRHATGRGRIKANHHWGSEHWMKGPVLHDGLLYVLMVDSAHVPQHYPLPWLGLDVYDAADGSRVDRLRAICRESTDASVAPVIAGEMLVACDGGSPVAGFGGTTTHGRASMVELGERPWAIATSTTGRFSATPIPAGESLLLRQYDGLVCVRLEGGEGGAAQEEAMAQKLFDQIPEKKTPPPMRAIAPPPAFEPGDDAPVNRLRSQTMPGEWLFCGPLPPGAEDPLAALGGPAAARPGPGTAFEVDGAEFAFRPVGAEFVDTDEWDNPTRLDILGPIAKETPSTTFYYTVLDGTRDQVVKFSNPGRGYRAWLAGEPLADDDIVELEIGRYPLLVEVPLGRLPPFAKKGLYIAPRFVRTEDPTAEFEEWVARVRRNKHRFERIVEKLPDSTFAGRARMFLEQLKQIEKGGE